MDVQSYYLCSRRGGFSLKKNWAKIGDTVQMTDKHLDWYVKHIPELYTFQGEYRNDYDSEILSLLAAKRYKEPLQGVVTGLGSCYQDDGTVRGQLTNRWGTYRGYLNRNHYSILKRAKKKKSKRVSKK